MVVGFFSFLGALTGILVETSIAAHLGLSRNSDTYYVALTIPYIITNLISATGQFSLVPFFASFDSQQAAGDLWHGFSYAINTIALGLFSVAVVGLAAAPILVRVIAPGFTAAQFAASAQLARWLMFIIVPAGIGEVFRSFLFSQHRFALSSAAGFFRNVCVIVFIVFGFRRYHDYSIVMGYFAGYFFQVAVLGGQVLWSFPVRYVLTLRGAGQSFRRLRGAGASQILAALAWQALALIERVIGSFLPPGTITALNYGLKIMSTIAELLAGSIGTSSLPGLSRAVANGFREGAQKIMEETLELSLVLVTPIMVCCLVLPRPIMQLVFERGSFSAQATSRMGEIFFLYCLSLLGYSFTRLLNYFLFARHEMSIFLRLSLLYYGLTAALDLTYVGIFRLGPKGIPLALLTSVSVTSAVIYSRDVAGVRGVFDRQFKILAGKCTVAAVLAAAAMWSLKTWIPAPNYGVSLFYFLCFVCGVGCAVFAAVLAAWRAIPAAELIEIWQKPES